jgi:hypothetical protein
MGVRLYPNTKNVANLEKLAGVPEGTAARFAELDTTFKVQKKVINDEFQLPTTTEERQGELRSQYLALEERQWNAVNEDEDIGQYDALLTFGFGKFSNPFSNDPDDYAGHFEGEQVAVVLKHNGINADAALCEGLHYC